MKSLIGARLPRLEDRPLLTGQARFIDDIVLPGMLHAAFVRSPHAHAAIRRIEVKDAQLLVDAEQYLTGSRWEAAKKFFAENAEADYARSEYEKEAA